MEDRGTEHETERRPDPAWAHWRTRNPSASVSGSPASCNRFARRPDRALARVGRSRRHRSGDHTAPVVGAVAFGVPETFAR